MPTPRFTESRLVLQSRVGAEVAGRLLQHQLLQDEGPLPFARGNLFGCVSVRAREGDGQATHLLFGKTHRHETLFDLRATAVLAREAAAAAAAAAADAEAAAAGTHDAFGQ